MLDSITIFWSIFNFLDMFIYFVLLKKLIDYYNERTTSKK